MIRYGVELISNGEDRVVMFDEKDAATARAVEMAGDKEPGNKVALFYAECGDDGKPISSEFHILNVWE